MPHSVNRLVSKGSKAVVWACTGDPRLLCAFTGGPRLLCAFPIQLLQLVCNSCSVDHLI